MSSFEKSTQKNCTIFCRVKVPFSPFCPKYSIIFSVYKYEISISCHETEARKKVRPTLKFMANCSPSQYGRPQEELNLPKYFNDFLKFPKIFFEKKSKYLFEMKVSIFF